MCMAHKWQSPGHLWAMLESQLYRKVRTMACRGCGKGSVSRSSLSTRNTSLPQPKRGVRGMLPSVMQQMPFVKLKYDTISGPVTLTGPVTGAKYKVTGGQVFTAHLDDAVMFEKIGSHGKLLFVRVAEEAPVARGLNLDDIGFDGVLDVPMDRNSKTKGDAGSEQE